MFLELPNINVPSRGERVCIFGRGEGAVGKSSVVERRETRKRENQIWGGGSRAASRGVAGIRQGGMCPKGESSGTSCWAEFEKDG